MEDPEPGMAVTAGGGHRGGAGEGQVDGAKGSGKQRSPGHLGTWREQ